MSGAEVLMAVQIAGAVATVAGTLASADASQQAGQNDQEIARSNQRQLEMNAENERTQSEIAAGDEERRNRRILARQRALYGGTGIEAGEGTPLKIREQTNEEIMRQAAKIRTAGEGEARALEREASIQEFRGNEARRAADRRSTGTLLTGLGQLGLGASRFTLPRRGGGASGTSRAGSPLSISGGARLGAGAAPGFSGIV